MEKYSSPLLPDSGLAYQGLGHPKIESLLSPCIVCSSIKCTGWTCIQPQWQYYGTK